MDIRLHFDDFWGGFNPNSNIWIWILKQKHNVVLDSANPNLVFTMDKRNYPNALTVYYSNEPFYPDYNIVDSMYDFSMANFFLDKPNYIRFPSYYMYIHEFLHNGLISDLSFFKKINREIPRKTNFCSFVSKSINGKRGSFFNKLNQYKKVDSNVTNDFHIPFDNSQFTSSRPKIEFIKKYKFNIAFENNFRGNYQCFPNAKLENGFLLDMGGLISEKLIEPFVSGTIPIYWGSEMVGTEFNSNTFLNYYDFNNEEAFIEKIIELDNNDELYNSYFNEPISGDNQKDILSLDYLTELFEIIVKKI